MLRMSPVALCLAAWLLVPASASAYGPKVRKLCANDYMDNCHTYRLGTPELKACMRKAGAKLSPRCVDALVESGQVSAAEVQQRRAAGK